MVAQYPCPCAEVFANTCVEIPKDDQFILPINSSKAAVQIFIEHFLDDICICHCWSVAANDCYKEISNKLEAQDH